MSSLRTEISPDTDNEFRPVPSPNGNGTSADGIGQKGRGQWYLWLLVIVVFVGNLIILLQPAGAPVIQLESNDVDFGQIVPGTSISRQLEIRNLGSRELYIQKITASCGCLSGSVSANIIPPGGHALLTLTVSPKPFPKTQSYNLVVISNDPETPDALLTIQYELRAEQITTIPESLNFGTIPADLLPKERTLRVIDREFGQARAPDIRSEGSPISTVVSRGSEGSWTVEVVVPKDTPLGEFEGQLAITFDVGGGSADSVMIPYWGSVRGRFYSVPSSVSIGMAQTESLSSSPRLLRINSRSGERASLGAESLEVSSSLRGLLTARRSDTDTAVVELHFDFEKIKEARFSEFRGVVICEVYGASGDVSRNRLQVPIRIRQELSPDGPPASEIRNARSE